MKRIILLAGIVAIMLSLWLSERLYGFSEVAGACESDCIKCHKFENSEATTILKNILPQGEIIEVKMSPIRGLWEMLFKVSANGQEIKDIIYVDFSKNNVIIRGQIINITSKTNATAERLMSVAAPPQPTKNPKISYSKIPIKGAIRLGDKNAAHKLIVFDDPD